MNLCCSFCCFQVENKVVKKRILNDTVVYPEKFSENARSICEGLLFKEVDKRLGFKDGSCDEIRAHPFFSEINWRKLNAGVFHINKVSLSLPVTVLSVCIIQMQVAHLLLCFSQFYLLSAH